MALTRCINYLLEGDEDILAGCIDESEMIEFAAKNALAIIVYDIVEEHEDDEDKKP